jgi:hypothetical protein
MEHVKKVNYDFVSIHKFSNILSEKNELILHILMNMSIEKITQENLDEFQNSFYDFEFTHYTDTCSDGMVEIFDKFGNMLISYQILYRIEVKIITEEYILAMQNTLFKSTKKLYSIEEIRKAAEFNIKTYYTDELFVHKNCTDEQEDEILFNLKMYVL